MNEDIEWNKILKAVKDNIEINSYNTWFSNIELISIDQNNIILKAGSNLIANFLKENYSNLITQIILELYNKHYNVIFTNKNYSKKDNTLTFEKKEKENRLNDNYTFEAFVVGKSNNFAHSAALSVAETPGKSYNPLFLYGESGMGKTHLMQAIGNYQFYNKNNNIFYTTTEEFTNEMIEAIQTNKMYKFREKYRKIDILLIDDIHFLARKERTQEEFFHTFNALYEKKIQIVMTSDRPPKDIEDLEKRLVTRFEWGLLADLKTPDLETRIAILKKKAESENILINDEVLNFISENIHDNVRSLEGSLIRLLAYCSCSNHDTYDLTVEQTKKILNDLLPDKISEISIENILTKVCEEFNITTEQILDKTRKKNIAFPRQIGMYLSNLLIPQLSLKEIANFYKRKDHSTVIHAKEKIETLFKEDNDIRIQINNIIKEIKGYE